MNSGGNRFPPPRHLFQAAGGGPSRFECGGIPDGCDDPLPYLQKRYLSPTPQGYGGKEANRLTEFGTLQINVVFTNVRNHCRN